MFEGKTKCEMARFGLLLFHHPMGMTGYETEETMARAFAAVGEWIEGKSNYQKSHTIAGEINDYVLLCDRRKRKIPNQEVIIVENTKKAKKQNGLCIFENAI